MNSPQCRRFAPLSFVLPVAFLLSAFLAASLATVCRAQPVQPVPKTLLTLDFAKSGPEAIMTSADAARATLTTDTAETIAGSARSLKGDSRASSEEWNEFFHSRDDLFPAHEAYRVSFDYRVIARVGDANFYTLFRRTGGKNSDGWTEWKGDAGATGHIEAKFSPRDTTNFFWIVGIHGKGAIAIDHLRISTDPAARPPDVPNPVRTWTSPGNTTYYVDSVKGNDANDGKEAKRAWRSLGKVNSGTFAPGDRILLVAGSTWKGYLSPGGSGAAGKPIVVMAFNNRKYDRASPPNPHIDAKGVYLATLYLHNAEHIEIRGLDIANSSPIRFPGLAGVMVREEDFGVAHHVILSGLCIHDVMGSNDKAAGGGTGIVCNNGGRKVKTCYDGLTIEDCWLRKTDRNGIGVNGNWVHDATWFPSQHVVIRGNRLEDIGGDGIVPIGCDGALVEHNRIAGGRMRAEDYAAGIWPWSCDNTTIQYNAVTGMHGTKDGEGYDSDYNCRNTLFQYNYSEANEGGFMLICTDGGQHPPWNIGNTGTVIRYNVSRNDGLHTFNITGPCHDTAIYNNTFYVGKGQNVKLVDNGNWGGAWASDTRFTNNLFYVDGTATFDLGGMTGVVFENNAFWGGIASPPQDAHAIPPGTPAEMVAIVKRISPPGAAQPVGPRTESMPLSGLKQAGKPMANNGGRDYSGQVVPSGEKPTVGAIQ